MTMTETTSKWRQVGRNQFEAEAPAGRYVWASDGVYGYARPLAEGEAVEQAVADFEAAGEPAEEVRVYQDGERVDEIEASALLSKLQDDPDIEGWICGVQVQVDRSGVGHCWVNVTANDIPYSIREEIEGEMIDGGKETCNDFVASNGLHYRW
jgi:hypothetical protein